MVLLTMTRSMVEALEKIKSHEPIRNNNSEDLITQDPKATEEAADSQNDSAEKDVATRREANIENPKIGNSISHGQVVDIFKQMKSLGLEPCRLETLLKGSRIYIPPPPPKPEPTSEFKALMARLRREEEARSYSKMINPLPQAETFAQRFPMSSAAHAFPSSYQSIHTSDPEDDGTTYADIDRQVTLIFNVLVSIVACAAGIWIVARWRSTPMRLALSMSGSLLVGVAEVVVYAGYIRRVGEAKAQEKKVKEIKEVVNTWVIEKDGEEKKPIVVLKSKEESEDVKARRRKKDVS